MKKDKNFKMLAVGLLLSSSSTLVDHFYPIGDFTNGFLKGLGIVFIIAGFYRIKHKPAR